MFGFFFYLFIKNIKKKKKLILKTLTKVFNQYCENLKNKTYFFFEKTLKFHLIFFLLNIWKFHFTLD